MVTITTESLAAMLALIGAVIAFSAMLSGFVERSNFPQVAVFLLLGAVLGPTGVGVLRMDLDSPVLRVVATLSLALVLFTDALNLNLTQVRKNAALAATILGPGTLITVAIIAGGGVFLLNLSWIHAAILAAALASTDPVLLRGLLRRPDLAPRARLALQLESGLNDAVLLPIVLVAMAFAIPGSDGVNVPKLLLQMLVLGPGAGALVALVGIGALEMIRRRAAPRRDYESIYSIGLCLAAFAAAESLHGSGYLAAFAAGLTISALDVDLCDCFKEYGETTAEMLLMFTFVLMGSSLIWSGLGLFDVALAAFVAVALAARPITLLATLRPLGLDGSTRRIVAWFGPRGLSTLLLVLVPVFAGAPGSARLFAFATVVVLFSVAIHGLSIMAFGRKAAAESPTPEIAPTPETTSYDTSTAPTEETVSAAAVKHRVDVGQPVLLVDVRSERSYLNSEEVLQGSVRLDLDRSVADAQRKAIPKDAWIALYCTCPSEQTSLRVARELRAAGWPNAFAVVGGWDAMLAQGFPPEPKSAPA